MISGLCLVIHPDINGTLVCTGVCVRVRGLDDQTQSVGGG